MGLRLETGDTGRAVTAKSDGSLYSGILGTEKYVLNTGNRFKAEVQTNNRIKINDGSAIIYGRHFAIPANDSELVTINNGTTGYRRYDLIAIRYSKENTGVESGRFVVLQGEATSGTPTLPEHIEGNILTGAAMSDMPLYRVEIDGINIVKVEPLFSVLSTMCDIQKEVNELNSALKTEITEINYQYYTSNTENTNIDMNFKIGNVVHLQCAFKRKDGGKYPISTGLIHIQNGSHRSAYNLTIPAYFRVGEQWYPHYVYVRTNGEIHQDFSNSAEEIIINGCYPVV